VPWRCTARKYREVQCSERSCFQTITAAAAFIPPAALAQTSTSPTGPAFSARFFTTPLENDPSREVRLQMQVHLPGRQGNPFHTHNGDQWEAVIEGEITVTVKGEQPRVLKPAEWVYIPRGTVHRNENKSAMPTKTMELLIMDKGKPQNNPAE
jgi:quercetin dioxygenase-like cupin family protein